VVCNADEGEPGTFKDRVLLTSYADLVFEGMSIAGYVVGARKGLLYLRGEYRYLLEPLESALAARRVGRPAGCQHPRQGLRFRHRDPSGRRRLCLRRGIGADRVAGRQAGPAAHPPALPGHARLPRPADDGEQRRDPGRLLPDRRAWRRLVRGARHREIRR
jgi:hypothetical protein